MWKNFYVFSQGPLRFRDNFVWFPHNTIEISQGFFGVLQHFANKPINIKNKFSEFLRYYRNRSLTFPEYFLQIPQGFLEYFLSVVLKISFGSLKDLTFTMFKDCIRTSSNSFMFFFEIQQNCLRISFARDYEIQRKYSGSWVFILDSLEFHLTFL